MKNYRIHFVRHGMTEQNAKGQYLGSRTDVGLATQGIKELIDLRESYEYPAVGVVYTSPMARCVETTGIIYPDREVMMVPELRELDFGDFEGKTMEDLMDSEPYQLWLANSMEVAPPNGEAGQDFVQRIIEGLQYIIEDMAKSEIYDAAVVTHGGVIMTLLAAIAMPRQAVQDWMVGNGRGYTCFVNTQLWKRDGIIEVAGIMPHGATSAFENPMGTSRT